MHHFIYRLREFIVQSDSLTFALVLSFLCSSWELQIKGCEEMINMAEL